MTVWLFLGISYARCSFTVCFQLLYPLVVNQRERHGLYQAKIAYLSVQLGLASD